MSHFNLPPGVSTNDIPGNRPEDEEEDRFWDLFHEKLDQSNLDVEQTLGMWFRSASKQDAEDDFRQMVIIARDIGYTRGYAEGRADKELELHMEQEPES